MLCETIPTRYIAYTYYLQCVTNFFPISNNIWRSLKTGDGGGGGDGDDKKKAVGVFVIY